MIFNSSPFFDTQPPIAAFQPTNGVDNLNSGQPILKGRELSLILLVKTLVQLSLHTRKVKLSIL